MSRIPAVASPANVAPTPLGVVLLARDAHANMDITLSGATIYDGDRLKTESNGSLHARLGGSQMYLGPSAAVDVYGPSDGFSGELIYGTVVLSSVSGQGFRLFAGGAIISPLTPQPTLVQVTMVNNHELLLTSRRGAIRLSLDDEVWTVEDGESYRIVIQPKQPGLDNTTGNPPQGKGGHPPEGPPTGGGPQPTARNRIILITSLSPPQ